MQFCSTVLSKFKYVEIESIKSRVKNSVSSQSRYSQKLSKILQMQVSKFLSLTSRSFNYELLRFLLARKKFWIERLILVQLEKENESSTSVLLRNTPSCGKKFFRISEHFSKSLISTALRKMSLEWLSFHRRKRHVSFLVIHK